MNQKYLKYLITAFNCACIIYLLVLNFYNCFALDDYCLYKGYLKGGFNSPINYWWYLQNGRYMPLYFCNFFILLFDKTGTIFWSTLSLYLIFISSIYLFFKRLLSYYNLDIPKNSWQIVLFLAHIIIFNNFKFATFYWLVAQWMYFGSICFYLIGISFIWKKNLTKLDYCIFIVSFWYVGCALENNAVTFIALQIFLYIISFWTKIPRKNLIISSIIILCLSLLTLLFSPGSYHRFQDSSAILQSTSFADRILYFLKIYPTRLLLLLANILVVHTPTAIFTIFTLVIIIKNLSNQIQQNIFEFVTKFKWIKIGLLILLILSNTAPVVFAMNQMGDQRTLTLVNIFLYLIVFIVFYPIFLNINFKKVVFLSSISLIFWCAGLVIKLNREWPMLAQYKQNQSQLLSLLNSKSKNQYVYKNNDQIYSSNASHWVVEQLITHFLPTKKSFIKYLDNEPIWVNRVENVDHEIFTGCFCEATQSKIVVKKIPE